jgi:hypothetical protein
LGQIGYFLAGYLQSGFLSEFLLDPAREAYHQASYRLPAATA